MVKKENVKSFRGDVEAAVAEVCKRYGVEASLGSISYNEYGGHIRLEWKTLDTDGKAAPNPQKERAARRWFIVNGVAQPKQVIGANVTLNDGRTGTVVDWHTKRPMYPLVVRIETHEYRADPRVVVSWE